MEDRPGPSRYVDYTAPGPSGYRTGSVSSIDGERGANYHSPERPPRRGRDREVPRERSRSRDSSRERYGGREVYYNPGLEADRAPSDRAESEFTVRNEALPQNHWEEEQRAASRAASEIYANARMQPRAQSEISHYTYRSGRSGRSARSGRSDMVSVKTKTTRGGKLVMETMTAPHPCCPNTKGVCCLMVLLNLALLLITLGFVVVLQLFEPAFVWYVGLSMLIFGFLTLFGSFVYCIFVCRDVEKMRPPPGEHYWTNHWTKTVNTPEIHYTNTQYKPTDYKGSEFSFKTETNRTNNNVY
ncbi:uncharacterized protein LOC143032877 [Oratosquilla oratoria]|uniref:uncharacterized protein LOC143032877 n=1 Tax=Oratosquilla oratoria TaxID=337810 RepID=UPI003F776AE9